MHLDTAPDFDPSPGNQDSVGQLGTLDEAFAAFCAHLGDHVWSKTRLHHYFRTQQIIAPYRASEVGAAIRAADVSPWFADIAIEGRKQSHQFIHPRTVAGHRLVTCAYCGRVLDIDADVIEACPSLAPRLP